MQTRQFFQLPVGIIIVLFLIAACQTAENPNQRNDTGILSLPQLSAVSLDNRPLNVVATTSMIGDVVSQVGGETIEMTVLMAPGQDPHSYEPSSGDLTLAADADVIFVNGWNLEESLIANLINVSDSGLLVPVSAGIDPLPFDEQHEEEPSIETADPHVWLDPHNVVQWVENIAQVLSALDPNNAGLYRQNAAEYQSALSQLIQQYDERLQEIAPENRKLVTNHDSFSYFARAYDFEIIGTVLPGSSTLAEPSANALAELVEIMAAAGTCTIFAETTANAELADTVAGELSTCQTVAVISLYTGALGPPGSGADTYLTMMTTNLDALVNALSYTIPP